MMKRLFFVLFIYLHTLIFSQDISVEIENEIIDHPQGKVFNAKIYSNLPDKSVITAFLMYKKSEDDIITVDKTITKIILSRADVKLGYIKKRFYPGEYIIKVSFNPRLQDEEVLTLIPQVKEEIFFEKSIQHGTKEDLEKMRKEIDDDLKSDYEQILNIYNECAEKFETFRKDNEKTIDEWKSIIKEIQNKLSELSKKNENRWDIDFYWKEERARARIKFRIKDIISLIEQFTEYLTNKNSDALHDLFAFSNYVKNSIEFDFDWLALQKPFNKEKISKALNSIEGYINNSLREIENFLKAENNSKSNYEKLHTEIIERNINATMDILELGEDLPEFMLGEFKKIVSILSDIESLIKKIHESDSNRIREDLSKLRADFEKCYKNISIHLEK